MTIFTKDWHAWLNTMPPRPDDFHVVGDVQIPNPGVEANLTMRQPQGINPQILLLDLHLIQKPGLWPQIVSITQARYDRVIVSSTHPYTAVQIFYESQQIAYIDKVDIVS